MGAFTPDGGIGVSFVGVNSRPEQYAQLMVRYSPMPIKVPESISIPSCREPYLYLDLLISIICRRSRRVFMPL
jgi:hypothetical protein